MSSRTARRWLPVVGPLGATGLIITLMLLVLPRGKPRPDTPGYPGEERTRPGSVATGSSAASPPSQGGEAGDTGEGSAPVASPVPHSPGKLAPRAAGSDGAELDGERRAPLPGEMPPGVTDKRQLLERLRAQRSAQQ